jgi:hypothetical protein
VYLDGAGIFTGAADFILWIYRHKTCSNGKGTWNIIIKLELSYYFMVGKTTAGAAGREERWKFHFRG